MSNYMIMCKFCKESKQTYCKDTCRTCYNRNYRNLRYHTDPIFRSKKLELSRWRKIKLRFGLDRVAYENLLIRQNYVCAICKQAESKHNGKGNNYNIKALAVDHDHTTGKIRGLLCSTCNNSLGHYEKMKPYAEQYLGTQ